MILVNGIFFILLFYGVCSLGLLSSHRAISLRKLAKSFSIPELLLLLIAVILPVFLIVYWSGKDHCIYYWDFAGYWSSSINQMHYMESHSLSECLKSVHRSINHVPYNLVLPSVISLPMHLFGISHRKFVMLNCILFYLPTMGIMGLTAVRIGERSVKDTALLKWHFIIGCITAFLIPVCYYPILRGYIDTAFLLPASIVCYLLSGYDYSKRRYFEDVALAFLFILIWISRRYAVYLIIGFVAAMMVKGASYVLAGRNDAAKRISSVVKHLSAIGILSLGILLISFRPFLLGALHNDYTDAYSAYDASLQEKMRSLLSSYGIMTFAVAALICVLCIITRYQTENILGTVCIGLVETLLFWQTQDMDIHHRTLLYLPVCMILNYGIGLYFQSVNDKRDHKRILNHALLAICLIPLCLTFFNAFLTRSSKDGFRHVFASAYQPIQRNDIQNLEELTQYLREQPDGGIYVAAAADVLNVDIIRKIKMPDSDVSLEKLLGTSDIDLRDGFPASLADASYIVCTDPAQTHLDSGQEVVRYISSCVQDMRSCIGRHYEEVFQVDLDRGVKAKVYRKISNFTAEDLQEIADHFSGIYPGQTDIFTDRILRMGSD